MEREESSETEGEGGGWKRGIRRGGGGWARRYEDRRGRRRRGHCGE